MKTTLVLLVIAGSSAVSGCGSVLRGGDDDLSVHFHLTYSMARSAGFDQDESLKIAASDYFTDEHPRTSSVATERRLVAGIANPLVIPGILFSAVYDVTFAGERPARAFGARTAEFTSWGLSSTALKLHFPAHRIYDQTRPVFGKDLRSGELYLSNREAVELLEAAFRNIETKDEDLERTLALLGIALHTLQDSYKHVSYCGAQGHIGANPSPDSISGDLPMLIEIAEATFASLRHAYRRIHDAPHRAPGDWRAVVRHVYESPSEPEAGSEDRWTRVIAEIHGDTLGTWDELRRRWIQVEGDQAFERALEKVERILR
jgi:hypothetical protein